MGKYILNASNILLSEDQSNRKYMTVRMRMFSTRKNLNGVAVTEAFIDRIMANKDEYVCMPLCADVEKLELGATKRLGHMYDEETGRFMAPQIGGFHDIEKVEDEYGISLFGEARINKRNPAVCETIESLYNDGKLNFSFEIQAEVLREEDGVTIVDADEGNDLMAMALVSIPAYPEAKAVDLVAEAQNEEVKCFSIAASDASLESIYSWIRSVQWEVDWDGIFGKPTGWPNLLFVTDSYFILYFEWLAEMYRFDYTVSNDGLAVSDMYKVSFVRVGEEEDRPIDVEAESAEGKAEVTESVEAKMEEASGAEAEAEAKVEVAEDNTTDVEAEAKVEETVEAEQTTEEEAVSAEAETVSDVSDEIENLKSQIEEMRKSIEELAPYKAEVERIEAEKRESELIAKKSEMKMYASNHGLNTEDEAIAKMIETLDYEALMSEVIKIENKEEPQRVIQKVYSEISDDGFGGMLQRV